MRLEVTHRTVLEYSEPVAETYMELRLQPREGGGQRVLSFELEIVPRAQLRTYVDGFGNTVHYFNSVPPHETVVVQSRSVVDTASEQVHQDGGQFPADFLGFREPVMLVAGVRSLGQRARGAGTLERLDALARRINRDYVYQPQTTDIFTAVDQVIRLRSGVCQDFAHLFISAARAMGIPCRYVSGYIHAGAGLVGTGASHAWAEAWVEGAGWVGYDPTNPVRAGENHVRVATGRDYNDVPPTRGTYVGAAAETMRVEVATHVI